MFKNAVWSHGQQPIWIEARTDEEMNGDLFEIERVGSDLFLFINEEKVGCFDEPEGIRWRYIGMDCVG